MKRPSFQFYPADWRKDANLRRCSPAARGVWMDVLCVLHDSDEYGIVRWPLKELASAAGASLAHLKELADKRVLKGCDRGTSEGLIYTPRHGRRDGEPVTLIPVQDGPIWFSARFVRDEYVRTIRGASTRFGDGEGDAPKGPPNDSPKPPFGDGASSASSPSGNTNTSGANAPGAAAPPDDDLGMTGEESRKTAAWRGGKSLLRAHGMPMAQTGAFIAKLERDFGAGYLDVIEAAIAERPADPAAWMRAACQQRTGARATNEPQWRAEQRERTRQAAPGVAAGAPASQFFIDVDAKPVMPAALTRSVQ